jgi:hypothetical protein
MQRAELIAGAALVGVITHGGRTISRAENFVNEGLVFRRDGDFSGWRLRAVTIRASVVPAVQFIDDGLAQSHGTDYVIIDEPLQIIARDLIESAALIPSKWYLHRDTTFGCSRNSAKVEKNSAEFRAFNPGPAIFAMAGRRFCFGD